MVLERILRHDKTFMAEAKDFLFTKKSIAHDWRGMHRSGRQRMRQSVAATRGASSSLEYGPGRPRTRAFQAWPSPHHPGVDAPAVVAYLSR